MEHLITDVELGEVQAQHSMASGLDKLELLVELAWHLRQRDTRLALLQAGDALAQVGRSRMPRKSQQRLAARVELIRGEASWLHHELDAAENSTRIAMQAFSALADPVGESDAHYLAARILNARSRHEERNRSFRAAADRARAGGDTARSEFALASLAHRETFQSLKEAEARWRPSLEAWSASACVPLRAVAHDGLGILASRQGDFRAGSRHLMEAIGGYRISGQPRGLMSAISNIGRGFANLNDHDSALAWVEEELEVARASGWPLTLAGSLLQAGRRLHQAGKRDAGYSLLIEAEGMLATLDSPDMTARALQFIGEVELEYGRFGEALARFRKLEESVASLGSPSHRINPLEGQAKSLSGMGCADEALAAARSALELARSAGNGRHVFDCLQTLAAIHDRYGLAAPDGSVWPNGALHHLHAALEAAQQIEGFTIPSKFLADLARRHADVGEHDRAYAFSLRAAEAHEREHSENARNRADALELRHQTDRARALAEHNAQLAREQKERAAVFAETSATLERLGVIGQEITAHLDEQQVFASLNRHVHGLLDATSFSIFLLSSDGRQLDRMSGVESGKPLPARSIPIDHPTARIAACARSRQELLIRNFSRETTGLPEPSTLVTLSALFAPLMVGDRLLGVMTLQSMRADAYGDRERLILRSLCAFGAIAFANAEAYRRLTSALAELHESQAEQKRINAERDETLAFLAHDLRMPLSAIVTLLPEAPEQPALRKASRLAARALTMTAHFLEIARLQRLSPASRGPLELAEVVDDAYDNFAHRAAAEGKSIDVKLVFGIIIEGHREALMRAFCNLLDNALKFSGAAGRISLEMQVQGDCVQVRVTDSGGGMPTAAQATLRADERGADGGSRLGLVIVADVARMHGARVIVETAATGTMVAIEFKVQSALAARQGA